MGRKFLLVLAMLPATAPAASFGLGAVLRVGGILQNELYLGSPSNAPSTQGPFIPGWVDGVDHAFQLSYDATTNTASLSANWLGIITSSVSWNPVGGSASSASRSWTLSPGALVLTAVNNPLGNTSVQLSNLQISGPGLAVINPPNLTAAQTGGGTVTTTNAAAITFITPDGGGSWSLTGQIRFSGINTIGAIGDTLRAAFDFTASDYVAAVPEPESLLLSALGFAALGVLHHFRARRRSRVVIRTSQAGTSSKA
jgi:hypothetical protein